MAKRTTTLRLHPTLIDADRRLVVHEDLGRLVVPELVQMNSPSKGHVALAASPARISFSTPARPSRRRGEPVVERLHPAGACLTGAGFPATPRRGVREPPIERRVRPRRARPARRRLSERSPGVVREGRTSSGTSPYSRTIVHRIRSCHPRYSMVIRPDRPCVWEFAITSRQQPAVPSSRLGRASIRAEHRSPAYAEIDPAAKPT